jgi:hypothetical protein
VLLAAVCVGVAQAFLGGALEKVSEILFGSSGAPELADHVPVKTVHANGVEVVNFAQGPLPKVRMGTRVVDLVNGLQFDDILQDSPDEIRAPAAVVFYDSNDEQCMQKYKSLNWDGIAETRMPARERLFAARYDMYSAPRRAWYKWVPELDLAKRMKVSSCPELVFVSRKCTGFTDWCVREEKEGIQYMGCEDFKDSCTDYTNWDGKGDMTAWLKGKIKADGEPKISPFLQTYEEQGIWMKRRDHTSSDNHLRNLYLAEAFPAFTKTGHLAMPIPKPFKEWLDGFLQRNKNRKRTEYWDSESTQMSFVEVPTGFYDLDRERYEKEKFANEYLKPIVEEWSGIKPLELTSFYGVREYPDGSFLKNHIDRIDTHILSVTMTVQKGDKDKAQSRPWPLEVVQWSGDHVRYDHPEGMMVLYESSKLPHGRPFRNKGGPHLGAFCHFKPVHMHGMEAEKWDEVAKKARANQAAHTQWGRYRSTPSEEPEHPVFAENKIGEGSKWKHINQDGDDDYDDDATSSFSIKFKNKSKRPLEVFWESPDGVKVSQGALAPGATFSITTYQGHRFFFAEKGSDKPLPASYMTAERGRSDYSYSL